MYQLYPSASDFFSGTFRKSFFLIAFCFLLMSTHAQLTFQNPVLEPGKPILTIGSVYRFSNVTAGVDALVRIDSLVNGAQVQNIDQTGFGYDHAFQPYIKIGTSTRSSFQSYAVFNIQFVANGTNNAVTMQSATATNIDLDGNTDFKELCEINMNGGTATYVSNTPQISVTVSNGKFLGQNTNGVEYNGIDTSARAVMFKVTQTNISSFKVRFGVTARKNTQPIRQFSLYMRDFQFSNSAVILPVNLLNFNATLSNNTALLNWSASDMKDFSHFALEKSNDGKKFSEAAVFFTNNTEEEFQFKDKLHTNTSEYVFYRLKMIDKDGNFTYSSTKMIRIFTTEKNITVRSFPNPVMNQLNVAIPQEWQNAKVSFEIYNQQGLRVMQVNNSKTSQIQEINVQQMGSGIYILKVSNGKESITTQIVKLK